MGDGHSPTVSEGKIHSSRAAKKELSNGVSFGRLVSPGLLSLPLVSSSNLITTNKQYIKKYNTLNKDKFQQAKVKKLSDKHTKRLKNIEQWNR
jgi:hypothetical protein